MAELAHRTAANYGLSKRILDDLNSVFTRYPEIEKVLIFGSRARGDHRPGSDIDLAVFSSTLGPQDFAKLWADIDETPIAFNIDLLHMDSLGNEELKAQIAEQGKILYPARNP